MSTAPHQPVVKPRGGWWVACQGALLLATFLFGLYWRNDQGRHPFPAACFLLIGALCGIAGTWSLGRNLTPFPRPGRDATLVRTGIYAFIRHPLYVAVFCGSVGWALALGSIPALVVALAQAPFFDAKARQEERWLREHFAEYADYERRVRRFIPWIY